MVSYKRKRETAVTPNSYFFIKFCKFKPFYVVHTLFSISFEDIIHISHNIINVFICSAYLRMKMSEEL